MKTNLDGSIRFAVRQIDSVLLSHGLSNISNNKDFVVVGNADEDYVEYSLCNSGSVKLRLLFTRYGVEIGVNEFYEFNYFSHNDIEGDSDCFKQYVCDLLFREFLIRKCAFGFNSVYVNEGNGKLRLFGSVNEGLVSILLFPLSKFSIKCKDAKYEPIYAVIDFVYVH